MKPGEGVVEGLKRKLNSKLAPVVQECQPDWEAGDVLCKWWRPNFETAMVIDLKYFLLNHIFKFRFIIRPHMITIPFCL